MNTWMQEAQAKQVPVSRLGFEPAFLDFTTMAIYPCRYAAQAAGRATLIPGFVRNGFFYTRTAAMRAAADWDC